MWEYCCASKILASKWKFYIVREGDHSSIEFLVVEIFLGLEILLTPACLIIWSTGFCSHN
jgi:hypothetical protein